MSAFASYLIGFIVLIVGLAIGAYLLNVPTAWIAVGIIVLLGLGIISASSRMRMRDRSAGSGPSKTTIVERRPPEG